MNGLVLVAAHDYDLVVLLATLVRLQGRTPIRARDGHAALALAEHYQPTLVLIDIPTPGIDSRPLIEGLRQASPDAQIILMSARDESELLARSLGVDGYIPRPFDVQQVLDYLQPFDQPLEQAVGA